MELGKINEWLDFSDKEIGQFQYYIKGYIIKNIKNLSKMQVYALAILGSELQYHIRCIKQLLNGDDKGLNIKQINSFIEQINSYNGLVDYIKDEFIKDFYKMPFEKQYQYIKEVKYSFFKLSNTN